MSNPLGPRKFTPELIERAARNVHAEAAAHNEQFLTGKEASKHARWLMDRAARLSMRAFLRHPLVLGLVVPAWVGFIVVAGMGVYWAQKSQDALPPCQTEDSVNCYWDADTMGNGEGRDFVVIEP